MKRAIIPIIITLAIAVGSCGPKRYLTTSRAPGVALDRINIGAYNNDPGADKARTAFDKADKGIAELNRLRTYDLEEDELAILMGATVTTAELNRISGVTSAVQTQINGRLRSIDSTGNAVGNYVTRKALRDTVAVRDAILANVEELAVENFGSTGTGNIVLSTGPAISSPVLTTPQIAPSDTTVTAVVGRIVFKTSDSHFYGCVALSGKKWKQLDN